MQAKSVVQAQFTASRDWYV